MLQVELFLEDNVYRVHHLSLFNTLKALRRVQFLQSADKRREVFHSHLLEINPIDLGNCFILLFLLVGGVICRVTISRVLPIGQSFVVIGPKVTRHLREQALVGNAPWPQVLDLLLIFFLAAFDALLDHVESYIALAAD